MTMYPSPARDLSEGEHIPATKRPQTIGLLDHRRSGPTRSVQAFTLPIEPATIATRTRGSTHL